MDITVEPLSNYPDAVPTVAEWHFSEWGHSVPGSSLAEWTAGMARQATAEAIPGTLIAVHGQAPVGVVCLVERDMPGYGPADGLTPWVKGLYVLASARRQGIGGTLMRHCAAWAASLGHRDLYLYTERDSGAQALYESLGWQVVHAGDYDGLDVTLMRTSLDGPGPQAPDTGGPRVPLGR
jgi:GNAT superfamily N-acetyltransferase